MPRLPGSHNVLPYPETRHKNFYWSVVDKRFARELQAFKGAHNRVHTGKSPSIEWSRSLEGFVAFLKEVGPIPNHLAKPSLGRKRHQEGYAKDNVAWEEHTENSIKRKGTRYAC